MAIRTIECHEAKCDECGDGFGAEEDTTEHYEDRSALGRAMARGGWTVVGDRVVCSLCAARIACELIGHRWDEWMPFEASTYSGRVRYCDHCAAPEFDPPVQPGPPLGVNR